MLIRWMWPLRVTLVRTRTTVAKKRSGDSAAASFCLHTQQNEEWHVRSFASEQDSSHAEIRSRAYARAGSSCRNVGTACASPVSQAWKPRRLIAPSQLGGGDWEQRNRRAPRHLLPWTERYSQEWRDSSADGNWAISLRGRLGERSL